MATSQRRRPQSARRTIAELLDDELSNFDNLMSDVRRGIRSPEHFDLLEEKATAIARGIRNAFRAGNGQD